MEQRYTSHAAAGWERPIGLPDSDLARIYGAGSSWGRAEAARLARERAEGKRSATITRTVGSYVLVIKREILMGHVICVATGKRSAKIAKTRAELTALKASATQHRALSLELQVKAEVRQAIMLKANRAKAKDMIELMGASRLIAKV